MTYEEAFEYITTYVVKEDGSIHIEDMNKYLEACKIVEQAIKKLRSKNTTC